MGCQATAHGECFVHAYQPLDPRIDKQVVANADLYRCGVAGLYEFDVQEGGVEHNVSMVAEEGVAKRLVYRQQGIVERTAVGVLTDNPLDDGFHEALLKVQWCLDACKQQFQETIANSLWQPRGEALQYHRELAVIQQFVEGLLHLSSLIRPYLVKLLHIHSN